MEIPAVVHEILAESLWLFLCIGLLIALTYGLLLFIRPRTALALNGRLNRWFSLRRSFKSLEQPRPQDRRLYRHHRALGAGLFLGSLYILYTLNYRYDHGSFILALAREMPSRALAIWLADSLRLLLYLFAFISLPLGVVVFQRPSLLKGLEARANRWISSRRLLRFMDLSYAPMEEGVAQHPRSVGLLLVLTALYLLLLLLPLRTGFVRYFA